MSDTPRTDAVLSLMPNDGFGLQKSQCIAQMADHSRILERENAALRSLLAQREEEIKNAEEALDNTGIAKGAFGHSLRYRIGLLVER